MVHVLAISILLLPIVTASGDEFWDDVDMINNDLSDPEGLPAPNTYDELSDPEELPAQEHPLVCRSPLAKSFYPKFITLRPAIIESFKQSLIIFKSPSKNISHTILEDKLQALGKIHNWPELLTYKIETYPKYWAKVCAIFWDSPRDRTLRVACVISRSYASTKKRNYRIRETKQYFDFLYCKCYTYFTNNKIPVCAPESFLIHKGYNNEYFIFEENQSKGNLSIKGFKDGIILPNISALEWRGKSSGKFSLKLVTLNASGIEKFNRALIINTSYPQHVSKEELEAKLTELEEIHEWPDLHKYDYEIYSRYWGQVCVYFWGEQLNKSHRQACVILPSLGDNKARKLLRKDRTQHFDLLFCKCHSYITNYRTAVSKVDTFLIHQSSDNEFFVFEQRATPRCKFTLFIRDFKGGITLPDPDDFN